MPGMSFSPATMTSRRRRNSSTICSTGSHGPVRAAAAAYWLNADVHDTELITSRVTGSTRAGGKTPKPSRQPVMAKVLDQPSSRIVRSAMPSTSSTLACGCCPYRMAQYTSSDSTVRSWRCAISAIASQSSRVSELPHGLCGELMISSFERSVISRSSSSVSMRNSLLSRSGTGTGNRAGERGDRLVHREAGVRVQHLVALGAQRHDREEHDRLGARRHDDAVRRRPSSCRCARGTPPRASRSSGMPGAGT